MPVLQCDELRTQLAPVPGLACAMGGRAPGLRLRLRAALQTGLAAGAASGCAVPEHPLAPGTAPVPPQCLHKQLGCQECADGASLRGAAKTHHFFQSTANTTSLRLVSEGREAGQLAGECGIVHGCVSVALLSGVCRITL